METQEIRAGIIITGPKWSEPVEIKKVDYTGDYVHIVLYRVIILIQLIPIEELSDISIRTVDTDFKSEAWKKNFLPWNQRGIDLLRYMIPCWL